MISQANGKISVAELEDVYPAIVVQTPPSFWSRLKRSIANMVGNVLCGTHVREYGSYFADTPASVSDTIPPV